MPTLSQELSDIFDHRYLKAWNHGRLWKKVFLVVGKQESDEIHLLTVKDLLDGTVMGSKLSRLIFGVQLIHQGQMEAGGHCGVARGRQLGDGERLIPKRCIIRLEQDSASSDGQYNLSHEDRHPEQREDAIDEAAHGDEHGLEPQVDAPVGDP